jgi:hypothetical protein
MAVKDAEKLDLYKMYKHEYAAPGEPTLIHVGRGDYLVASGRGAPGGQLFQARVGALYGMAYTLKFESKSAGRDFAVSKLEGLYGVDGQSFERFLELPAEEWNWRLAIRVPDFLGREHLEQARATLRDRRKPGDWSVVSLDAFDEGECVQMLHVGPYREEARTLEAMRVYARSRGLAPALWHHEIYLSDPRRVPARKLRTILRQPVRAA